MSLRSPSQFPSPSAHIPRIHLHLAIPSHLPHLRTVHFFDESEGFVIGVLPTLPVDLVARITDLAFYCLSEVSQQFLELINITFTNVETFGFHAIRDQISLNAVSGFKRLRWLKLYPDKYSSTDTVFTSIEEKACHSSYVLQEVTIRRRTGDCFMVGWDRERGWVEVAN
ncbi:hypothetical protein M422DRAFT_267312 [Sphaerobolus stellatus SS14]|uniref:Uncharacterized protein n=1 Tax=Sphaerobolus stellatus (strain SS14) TaxID=990650 RepID=A0A0C9TMB3_SPHS4|nr:hypothetical protein M422DRAFT_267312 [Sphaerobolus stellatus SS14]